MIKVVHKPEEFLSIHLIEFTEDVLNSVLETRYHDVFDGIYAPVCRPNDFIQDRESSLE